MDTSVIVCVEIREDNKMSENKSIILFFVWNESGHFYITTVQIENLQRFTIGCQTNNSVIIDLFTSFTAESS